MPLILRTPDDQNNPTLPGGVYYVYITIGKAFYYFHDGVFMRGGIMIADGGKYGLDSVSSFEFNGSIWTEDTEWIFHRGTFSSQIDPRQVSLSGSTFTITGSVPVAENDPVRLRSIEGNLPVPLEIGINEQSKIYYVKNLSGSTLQLSLTPGGAAITMTNPGSGQLILWKANKGFDDPDQGLPTFIPEVQNTFNNIAWVEFKKNMGSSDEPDWSAFRIFGVGRRLMDYDADGNEVGIVAGDELLGNPALIVADNYLWNMKGKNSRIDWASWFAMRTAALVQILHPLTEAISSTGGFTGRYFADSNFTNQIASRQDATINIPSTSPTLNPIAGVSGYGFSVIWKAKIEAGFSELYTFKFIVDDGVEFIINGNSILNVTTVGTHTVQYSLVAGQYYDIEIRYYQQTINAIGNLYRCQFYWSSASLPEQIVPASATTQSDEVADRYLLSLAFNTPTEGAEVHELAMERVVGWDWTDKDGKIAFLPPDRPVIFEFEFDRLDDDSRANFAGRSFEKKRRLLAERENFKLGRYRYLLLDGYPYRFVQADRDDLRKYAEGTPSNAPFIDIGVTTESQAKRFLEHELVIKSDPDHISTLDGGLDTSVIYKNGFVTVRYIDEAGEVVDEKYLVTLHSWGASDSRNNFSLLPIEKDGRPFYSDEPVN